jgi:pimeloyl-ACP methyl ester carboxylesterase
MIFVRVGLGAVAAYALLVLLAWVFQERLAFPAPRGDPPDPKRVGFAAGERIELVAAGLRGGGEGGTKLVGWYLPPRTPPVGAAPFPGLLWFYGNGETIAAIWPVLRDFQPPTAALLVVDYPGYGGSDGSATERGLYEAADLAYAALRGRPGVDAARIFVYGRSLGSAVATYTAATHSVAGLILESPFTNAAAMSRQHYALLPRFILRLRLDNLNTIRQVHCPVLVFHGTDDRLVPSAMGTQVAAAVPPPGPVELVLIRGAGHNDTYEVGAESYRRKLAEFVGGVRGAR